MNRKLQICVVTHDFPTREQPYRGAPIWQTLSKLRDYADLAVYCPVPQCPALLKMFVGGRIYGHQPAPPSAMEGLRVHALRYFAIPMLTHSQNGRTLKRELERAWRGQRPDLILSYWIYPDSYAAVQAGEAAGVPVVVCSRGSDLKVVERSRVVRESIRYTLTHAAAVLGVSKDLAQTAERLGARPENVYAIVNGVDSSIFHWRSQAEARRTAGVDPEMPLVTFVGRLVPGKGILQLLEAVALLGSKQQRAWRLVIVGEGPLRGKLEQQAASLGLDRLVDFTGPLPSERIACWLAASDFLCLPSESEGCPNVIREAHSCGCPVVATSVGGIPEMVDERNGILMRENSPAQVAAALGRAYETHWDRLEIARRATRGWDHVARETYEVCNRVLGGDNSRAHENEVTQPHAIG